MGRRREKDLDLPKNVYRHHGAFRYVSKDGPPIVLGRDKKAAIAKYEDMFGAAWEIRRHFWPKLLASSRKNARMKGIEFTIDAEYIESLYIQTNGNCSLSGVPFSWDKYGKWSRRPWIPSIDRIDPQKGYVPGNVRIVAFAMNNALNQWGEGVFQILARGYLQKLQADLKAELSPPESRWP